jgi:hypothetical protein
MADFATHLGWGAVGAGLVASTAYAIDIVSAGDIMPLTIAGVVGSVLPDIDLEKAMPSRMLFTGLGLGLAFIVLFNLHARFSLAELWLIWLSVFLIVRYGAFHIFHRTATHRGVFHSLLAGIFFMGVSTAILANGLHHDAVVAWMGGLFVLLGYITHLILDEIYAVDFTGGHIKSSFGSALKLFEYSSARSSALMLVATVALVPLVPSPSRFLEVVRPEQIAQVFRDRMLPRDGWFKSKPLLRSALPNHTGTTR